jgi:type III secretion protein Q
LTQSLDVQLALAFGPTLPCTIRFPVGAETVALTLAHSARLPTIPLLTICISGTVNDDPFTAYVDWAHVDACLDALATGLAAAVLAPETKALLVEAALADHLDTAEKAVNAKIVVSTIEMLKKRAEGWVQPNLKFAITWGDQLPRTAYATVPANLERRLIAAWSGRLDGIAEADPELSVTVRVGCLGLGVAELAELAVDDVLVLDDTPLYNKQCCLVVGERLAALGNINGNQLLLTEPLALADGSWNAKYCVSETTVAVPELRNGRHNGGQQPSPRIRLAVDLARQKIRLSQLLGIDLGRAIGLPKSIETGVEVFHGAKSIGLGNIVRVGDAIAVRLVKVTRHG